MICGLSDEVMKGRVRERLAREMPDIRFSFEPSDIVNEVMSFGVTNTDRSCREWGGLCKESRVR